MKVISGRDLADNIKADLRYANERDGSVPCLAIVVVGDNRESLLYVGLKEKAVESIGGKSVLYQLPSYAGEEEILNLLTTLNGDNSIDGILLQLPLPERLEISRLRLLAAISPEKDVDGFHPYNMGLLCAGHPGFVSCAALACLEAMQHVHSSLAGKKVLLAGDSFDVIIPLAIILSQKSCQVTLIKKYEPGTIIPGDIVVVEKGEPRSVKGESIKPGTLVIDAGFFADEGGVCGNADRESLEPLEGYLVPVPGGIGPLLIAKLMENLCRANRREN